MTHVLHGTESAPLQGKVALVTGAGRGIGRAIALAYAQAGAHVVLVSRTESELAQVAGEISRLGGAATLRCADVTHEQLSQQLAETLRPLPGLDVVLINAGGSYDAGTLERSNPAEFRRTFEVNVHGAYNTLRAVIPQLRRRGGGRVIVLGSGMGHRPGAGSGAYAASKAAVWMLTRVAAEELIADGILVNELIPGPVDTSIGGSGVASILAHAPNERVKPPEDVAPLALFLASIPAGGPTGQSFSLARRAL